MHLSSYPGVLIHIDMWKLYYMCLPLESYMTISYYSCQHQTTPSHNHAVHSKMSTLNKKKLTFFPICRTIVLSCMGVILYFNYYIIIPPWQVLKDYEPIPLTHTCIATV